MEKLLESGNDLSNLVVRCRVQNTSPLALADRLGRSRRLSCRLGTVAYRGWL